MLAFATFTPRRYTPRMPTARRHHYIPEFYLKGFAAPRKKVAQVTVFDRRSRAPFVAAISNVGVERDFNRIDAEGYTPDHVEKGMAEIRARTERMSRWGNGPASRLGPLGFVGGPSK